METLFLHTIRMFHIPTSHYKEKETKLFNRFLCKFGFHKWLSVIINQQPHRECLVCDKIQELVRGSGCDDWFDVDDDKLNG